MTYDHWKTTDPRDARLGDADEEEICGTCGADEATCSAECKTAPCCCDIFHAAMASEIFGEDELERHAQELRERKEPRVRMALMDTREVW